MSMEKMLRFGPGDTTKSYGNNIVISLNFGVIPVLIYLQTLFVTKGKIIPLLEEI
jgi:hypothetical protein